MKSRGKLNFEVVPVAVSRAFVLAAKTGVEILSGRRRVFVLEHNSHKRGMVIFIRPAAKDLNDRLNSAGNRPGYRCREQAGSYRCQQNTI